MKKFENEFVTIEMEDDILFVHYKTPSTIDMTCAKKVVEDRLKFTEGKPCYVLTDLTDIKPGTKEAREYLCDPNGGLQGILAGAFVSDKLFSYALANLFLKINKPPIPSKIFSKKEDALKWLMEIKNGIEK